MAGKAGAAKAAGTVAAGGGPEDPVTDAVAIGQLAGSTGGGTSKAPKKAAAEVTDEGTDEEAGEGSGDGAKKGGRGRKALGWTWSDNRRLLLAEFVICVAVLGAGTLVSPEDSKHDVPRAMIKGSALAAVFFLLALVASGGQKPARVANAIGTLITATYVLTSADVHNLVTWIGSFFSPASAGEKAGSPVGSKGEGGAAEGEGLVNGQPSGGSDELGVTQA
jgi:hypothetical protein